MLSFVIWDFTSLNFYLILEFVNAVHHTLREITGHRGHRMIWNIILCPTAFVCVDETFYERRGESWSAPYCCERCVCVCMVINVCLSHGHDAEVLKNRPLSLAAASSVFSFAFLSLTCHEEKHITRCCCPCGYELKHVTGVCASVFKCALLTSGMSPDYPVERNCIETGERVSPPSNSDTERPQLRADTYISRLAALPF